MRANKTASRKFHILAYEPDKDTAPPAVASREQQDPHAQLAQYQTDRRSAFIGSLPHDSDEREVRKIAEDFGNVLSVRFHVKRHSNGASKSLL